MVLRTGSPRRLAFLAGVALSALLVVAGCSSSKDDAAGATTTTTPASSSSSSSSTAPTSSTATTVGGTGPTTTSGGGAPSSPSSIPASVSGTCEALAETYGLDDLQPKNTSSWPDERQRVVVDAQREAALLGVAQQGAPAEIAPRLRTLAGYASWLATTMQGAGSFSEAVAAIDAYPDLVPVSLAVANVRTWQKANCPE